MHARASGGPSPLRRRRERYTQVWREPFTCPKSWETHFSHAFATDTMSPLRKHAPCGRPAHRLGDCAGRSPGSRVGALRPAFPVSQWPCWTRARRLQLRGQPRIAAMGGDRVPSFLPGLRRGTSTIKSSLAAIVPSSAILRDTQGGQRCGWPPASDLRSGRAISSFHPSARCAWPDRSWP